MSQITLLDGNGAVAEALRLARVQVVASYPQFWPGPIAKRLSGFMSEGRLKARYVLVESEQAALSCVLGAELAGLRAATAVSAAGLAVMPEACAVTAGLRAPVVVPVLNHQTDSPLNLRDGQLADMGEGSGGWIQLYAANCQEFLDLLLIAYRVAEHREVLRPAMVGLDGCFKSQPKEAVFLPDSRQIDSFLPPLARDAEWEPAGQPGGSYACSAADWAEASLSSDKGKGVSRVLELAAMDYANFSGRNYGLMEAYRLEEAEAVIVALGSMTGTLKYMVDLLRSTGRQVGLLRLIAFRPFPAEELARALAGIKNIGVLDRSLAYGEPAGPLCSEVRAALGAYSWGQKVSGFLGGLDGQPVSLKTIGRVFDFLLAGNWARESLWLGLNPDDGLGWREAV